MADKIIPQPYRHEVVSIHDVQPGMRYNDQLITAVEHDTSYPGKHRIYTASADVKTFENGASLLVTIGQPEA